MKTIWKYPLEVTDTQIVAMPAGAQLLCVQAQFGEPQLWALVDPGSISRRRIIRTLGTGHPLSEEDGIYSQYLGTYQLNDGELVFHVFASPEGN